MKIISFFASMPNYDLGLRKVTAAIYDIFSELDIDVTEIDINKLNLPSYDGTLTPEFNEILDKIQDYNGIMFSCTSSIFGPSSLIQNFIEYIIHYNSKDIFSNKNCLFLTISEIYGEKITLDYLSRVVNYFEGFDSVKIGFNKDTLKEINNNDELKEIFEKQVEDYYRLVRQNRKFFIPKDHSYSDSIIPSKIFNKISNIDLNDEVFTNKNKISLEELNKKYKLESNEDINEITKFFASKFEVDEKSNTLKETDKFYFDNFEEPQNAEPRERTVKQITQSLPHYFKANSSNNISFILQVFINSTDNNDESFESYLEINNNSCTYYDGQSSAPDIVIYCNSNIWRDILTGNKTSQKSFMTGQLKVKGNFVLLTKFDQLFNPVV